jgi:tRNA(Arg) A34 adenosine deaminase TadA
MATESYIRRGSAPIGAVITDEAGAIVARGGNDVSTHRLAHAEMEAFANVPPTLNRRKAELYVTLEPCPMCSGALRMMQLGAVTFAARDPAAGSTRVLSAQGFMSEIPCIVRSPSIPALEQVVVALLIEHRTRTGHNRWSRAWEEYQPAAYIVGQQLASNGAYGHWLREPVHPAQLYESVGSLCADA